MSEPETKVANSSDGNVDDDSTYIVVELAPGVDLPPGSTLTLMVSDNPATMSRSLLAPCRPSSY